MESLKEKLQSPAFTMFVLYFVTALFLVLFLDKGTFLLWLNKRHNPFGNFFFQYVTHFGEGLIYIFIVVIFLFYRYYNALILAFAGVLQYGIVQIAKAYIFDTPRPSLYYESEKLLYNVVEGVNLEAKFSFPSGHTATAFTLATLLICFTSNKLLQVLYMLIAILVAISRVYLFQHFLVDTVGGAVSGLLIGGIIWWYFSIKNPQLLYNRKVMQQGLIVK
ncbi:hypothetical protein C9994_02525 [Marivirga lumbricoides]|uniref:Phosphatidic acid phosphatase type 2/haloperoxidase domain-containing protein n=1 Tax=Marivirga lumbricoides TaxID=1046115 RepID=A0A2T4DUK3_9BACT|nr:hypothetical protein C9994_02525 [Marivirga lumbricoides]